MALTEFSSLIIESQVKPTWFEFMIAFSFWMFAKEKVDYAVIEVGLGGLKDGTNVINRSDKICIITDIGYDHMNILGNSLAEISEQKAGIILSKNIVLTNSQPTEIMRVLKNAAASKKASLHIVSGNMINKSRMPDYQFRNWKLALEAYKYIASRDNLPSLSNEALTKSQQTIVPGRMHILENGGKTIILDGAHNAQKMMAFTDSFRKLYPGIKPAVLIAFREGKDYEAIVPILIGLASRVIVTTFDSHQDLPIKSMPAELISKSFENKIPVKVIPDQRTALSTLLQSPDDYCVITGSLCLLGQLHNSGLV